MTIKIIGCISNQVLYSDHCPHSISDVAYGRNRRDSIQFPILLRSPIVSIALPLKFYLFFHSHTSIRLSVTASYNRTLNWIGGCGCIVFRRSRTWSRVTINCISYPFLRALTESLKVFWVKLSGINRSLVRARNIRLYNLPRAVHAHPILRPTYPIRGVTCSIRTQLALASSALAGLPINSLGRNSISATITDGAMLDCSVPTSCLM